MLMMRLQPKMLVRFSDGLLRIQTASEQSLMYARFGFLRHRILKHSLHSSSVEEDDFSELDVPPEGQGTHFNFIGEQLREPWNLDIKIKAASDMHMGGEDNLKDITSSKGNHSLSLSSVVEKRIGISKTKGTGDPELNVNSNSVTIANVPTTISLRQLKKASSEFGEVLNASVRSEQNGFSNYYVQFKTVQAKERALASRGINVNSCHLPIYSLSAPENITIRISNMNPDTAEPAIHSACIQCGPVEGLLRTNNGSVDVVFSVKDSSAIREITERLNAVCVDNRWSAEILPDKTASTVVDSAANTSQVHQEAGSELTSVLENFQRQYKLKKIFLDDLMSLHQAVVHLQSRPT